jgi:PAS domain S-box-containing protein
MSTCINLLVIEDKPADFRLITRHLEKHGLAARCHCVANIEELEAAVEQGGWDAVLSDYSVPNLDFQHTLGVFQARHPDVPLILVSGSVGEERAVELLKLGVWDFVLKDSLTRLVPAIERGLRDATEHRERRRVEAALRESEQQHRTILQTAMDGFWMTDLQGRLLEVNEAYCRMSGYSASELLARGALDLEAGKTADVVAARIQKIMAQGEDRFESRHRRKNGIVFDVEISIQYQPVEGGRLVAFLQDITARKQAEEERARLAMAVDQAAETVVITDASGTILYANPAFEKTTGYTCAEALGQNPRILKSGRHDAEFYRQLWTVLGHGEVWTGRFINKKKDGTLYEEDASISPVRDAAGKVVNYVAVKRDVTREMQLEAQLRQSQKMEAVGQLAGGVAHDFNNILAVIRGNAELLLAEGQHTDETREGLNRVVEASERAANLTRQLLAFSRKQVMQPRPLMLNEVVANLTKMLNRVIRENINLQCHYAALLPYLQADPGMIEQVILNLVINARDAMPGGGQLRVATEHLTLDEAHARANPKARAGEFVCLLVSDTGTGIAPEVLIHIFEPFFTTKEAGKGTGLGLASVYGIVEQHQGWIEVSSQVGEGSTFKVVLPAIPTPARLAAAAEAEVEVRGGKETILLVEDEHAVRLTTRRILASKGYTIREAASAGEALELWQSHAGEIALLLTDIIMPGGMSGHDLAGRLWGQRPGLRVIFMSGYSANVAGNNPEFARRTRNHYLQKPFSSRTLLEAVRRCLDEKEPIAASADAGCGA